MKRRRPAAITVDVIVAAKPWRAVRGARTLARKAAAAALAGSRKKVRGAEVAVVLTSDAAVRRLNAAYRGKDRPTNVLSFPAAEGRDFLDGAPGLLGDVVLAYGTMVKEARADAKPLKNHLLHLVVHGVLHLLGYDHGRVREAQAMEALETKILAGMGVPDPYAAVPSNAPARKRRAKTRKARR